MQPAARSFLLGMYLGDGHIVAAKKSYRLLPGLQLLQQVRRHPRALLSIARRPDV